MAKINFHEAVEYVWKNSKEIRDWYITEHHFDLDDYTRSEYRTSGLGAPGDIISEIVIGGVRDGVINVDENGEFWTIPATPQTPDKRDYITIPAMGMNKYAPEITEEDRLKYEQLKIQTRD